MISSSSPKETARLLEQLTKLKLRLKGKTLVMPNEQCKGVDFHLAGMFLKQHIDTFIELLKAVEAGDPYD